MKIRPLFLAGIAAPLLYVAAVVTGGACRPDYHHAAHAISELTQPGAPHKLLLDALFGVYNVLCIVAAIALWRTVRILGSGVLTAGSLVLITTTVLGGLMTLFPMDPRGAVPTIAGTIHLVDAGVTSLLIMLAVGLIASGARRVGRRGYSTYAWMSLVAIAVFGAIAGMAGARVHPLMGLAERMVIGSYLQWMLVTCWVGWRGGFGISG
jgi:hypothetical membrane protein